MAYLRSILEYIITYWSIRWTSKRSWTSSIYFQIYGKIGCIPSKDCMFGNVPLKDRFFAIYHGKITTLRFVAFLLTLLTPSVPPAPLRPNRRRRRWGEGTSSATTTPPRSTRSAAGRSTAATSARWSTGEPASALISVAFVFLHFPLFLASDGI